MIASEAPRMIRGCLTKGFGHTSASKAETSVLLITPGCTATFVFGLVRLQALFSLTSSSSQWSELKSAEPHEPAIQVGNRFEDL